MLSLKSISVYIKGHENTSNTWYFERRLLLLIDLWSSNINLSVGNIEEHEEQREENEYLLTFHCNHRFFFGDSVFQFSRFKRLKRVREQQVVESGNINTFKTGLDSAWVNKLVKFPIDTPSTPNVQERFGESEILYIII